MIKKMRGSVVICRKEVAVVWIGFDHLAPLGERETATAVAFTYLD